MVRELLKRHEGLSLAPYMCPAGKMTIGYGHNIDANPLPYDIDVYLRLHECITMDMAEQLLDEDIDKARKQCMAIFDGFDNFTEVRQAALIDFCFNLGADGMLKFKKMLAAIADGDWELAADSMLYSKWFGQVGVRGPEIVGMIRKG